MNISSKNACIYNGSWLNFEVIKMLSHKAHISRNANYKHDDHTTDNYCTRIENNIAFNQYYIDILNDPKYYEDLDDVDYINIFKEMGWIGKNFIPFREKDGESGPKYLRFLGRCRNYMTKTLAQENDACKVILTNLQQGDLIATYLNLINLKERTLYNSLILDESGKEDRQSRNKRTMVDTSGSLPIFNQIIRSIHAFHIPDSDEKFLEFLFESLSFDYYPEVKLKGWRTTDAFTKTVNEHRISCERLNALSNNPPQSFRFVTEGPFGTNTQFETLKDFYDALKPFFIEMSQVKEDLRALKAKELKSKAANVDRDDGFYVPPKKKTSPLKSDPQVEKVEDALGKVTLDESGQDQTEQPAEKDTSANTTAVYTSPSAQTESHDTTNSSPTAMSYVPGFNKATESAPKESSAPFITHCKQFEDKLRRLFKIGDPAVKIYHKDIETILDTLFKSVRTVNDHVIMHKLYFKVDLDTCAVSETASNGPAVFMYHKPHNGKNKESVPDYLTKQLRLALEKIGFDATLLQTICPISQKKKNKS